jgi:DNA-binding PadR family transcriptional regulator
MRKHFFDQAGPWPWAGFAYGRRGRFFESGEVRLALLSLLGEGPKHGYQLMKELEERSGGVYKASAGTIYPTLQQMEDEGLVEAAVLGGRRTYSLTAAGRAELERDPAAVRRIWERAEQCEDWSQCWAPEAMAAYGPLVDLFKVGIQAAVRVGARREGAERLRTILDRARRELEAL